MGLCMRCFLLVAMTVVDALLNLQAYMCIASRGGFEAWKATNMFWSTALLCIIMVNIMYLMGLWLIWFTRND